MPASPDLFGGVPKAMRRLEITLELDPTQLTTITLKGWPENRANAYVLRVNVTADQSPGHVLGHVVRLLHHHWMPPKAWREVAATVAGKLGAEGYVVELTTSR